MVQSKLVPCGRCGFENPPQHSFCGKCGFPLPVTTLSQAQPTPGRPSQPGGGATASPADTPLKSPQDPARPPSHAPNAVAPAPPQQTSLQREPVRTPQQPPPYLPELAGGPSLLGPSDKSHADRERARYLLEDEPKPANYGRELLILLLFIAVMGAAVWHWRENLRGLGAQLVRPATQNNPQSTDTSASPSPAAVGATTPPGTDANAGNSNPSTSNAPASSAVPGNPSAPDSSAQPPAATASAQNPPSATPAPTPSQPSATPPDQSSTAQPPPVAPNNVTPPAETATPPLESITPKPTPRPPKPAATPPPAAAADSLETQGENYLYGNGVRQNCGRAQKKLLAAASHADTRAYSVLGTMFATGHCAPRDLPMAYRWFAKALHQDPTNTRIEADLKALWNQMTPDERQLALRQQ